LDTASNRGQSIRYQPTQNQQSMKRPIFLCSLLAGIVLSLVSAGSSVAAEGIFKIDWFTVDGGGGTCTGGGYRGGGSIGQFDSGAMTSANYSLVGGFWSIFAPQGDVVPPLAAALSSQEVIISWPLPANGWVLEQAPELASVPALTSWSQVNFPYQTN